MKKIGILQVDGTKYNGVNFPNISLMKISSYYKSIGYGVEWYKGNLFWEEYEKIYASKIFSFSPMPQITPNMIIGGTGIDFYNKLPIEIEESPMDWEIYPNIPFHYGFSMKGCRFKCSFCCVPTKEGKAYNYNTIDELLINPTGGKNLMLLDNDFFGGKSWKQNLERIVELDLKVCFVQGLNIRIISDKQAELLSKVNYRNSKFNKKYLTFAWDSFKDERVIIRGIERCNKWGISCSNMQFFVLIGYDTTPEQDYHRVELLRSLGCKPYVMPYDKSNEYQRAYTRYVNNRIIFNSCTWLEYQYNPFKDKKEKPMIDNDGLFTH